MAAGTHLCATMRRRASASRSDPSAIRYGCTIVASVVCPNTGYASLHMNCEPEHPRSLQNPFQGVSWFKGGETDCICQLCASLVGLCLDGVQPCSVPCQPWLTSRFQTEMVARQVVTLDGTMITRTGVMSGGMSSDIENRARRWDDCNTKTLKQVKRCLHAGTIGSGKCCTVKDHTFTCFAMAIW